MCGILLHFKEGFQGEDELFSSLKPVILARGTDFSSTLSLDSLQLFSSVLSLRKPLTKQPFVKDDRYVIQFNGELYNEEIHDGQNDIEFAYTRLIQNKGDVVKTVGEFTGGFAYCITDRLCKKVYFGRDVLGKRALCYSATDNELYVSSCFPADKSARTLFTECLDATVYVYDMASHELSTIDYNEREDLPDRYVVGEEGTAKEDESALVKSLKKELLLAVRTRISTIFPVHPASSNFAILFSGGIDCTLLAALSAEILIETGTKSTIDLLNVSFFNPRTNTDPADTPDRKLAIRSWTELQHKYASSLFQFNLVKIDVPYESYLANRQKVVDLIYPNDTEMDLSIAIAFYFATSGKGVDSESKCKVLLSGLGADELYGGYTRHERIFTRVSNQKKRLLAGKPAKDLAQYDVGALSRELKQELQHDLGNLHVRNLSRDDKVISSWSKEVRYPYLDDRFIRFSCGIPLEYKLHYNAETGEITRKYLLRLLARHMGLLWVESEPKRAIQFGAKSAKMKAGSSKMKGTDKLV